MRAGEVERAEGIMGGTDQVHGIKPEARYLDGVPQRRGFGGRQELSKSVPALHLRHAQPVRRRRRNRR